MGVPQSESLRLPPQTHAPAALPRPAVCSSIGFGVANGLLLVVEPQIIRSDDAGTNECARLLYYHALEYSQTGIGRQADRGRMHRPLSTTAGQDFWTLGGCGKQMVHDLTSLACSRSAKGSSGSDAFASAAASSAGRSAVAAARILASNKSICLAAEAAAERTKMFQCGGWIRRSITDTHPRTSPQARNVNLLGDGADCAMYSAVLCKATPRALMTARSQGELCRAIV